MFSNFTRGAILVAFGGAVCFFLESTKITEEASSSDSTKTPTTAMQVQPHAGKDARFDAYPTTASLIRQFSVAQSITGDYSKIAAIVVASMIFLAILPILHHNGIIPFVVVLVYLTSLLVVKFAVKHTMSSGYSYPYTITAFHMLSSALVARCFDKPKISEALKVLPISLMNGASLALGNHALLYGGVAFTSMVGACAPAPTYAFEILRRHRSHWMDGLLGTCLVCAGTVLCVHGETSASFWCFVFSGGATVCRSLKTIAQQELLALKVSPMIVLFWTGFWGFLFLLPIIVLKEGGGGLKSLPSISTQTLLALLLSIVAATTLNVCQINAVKFFGSLQQVTIGGLNNILTVALAAAIRGEVILNLQYLGIALVMLGTPLSRKRPPEVQKDDIQNCNKEVLVPAR